MTPESVLALTSKALIEALIISAPMLVVGLVVGVAISLFQAVTQIQEISLSFIPKILAMVAALLLFSHWMLQRLMALCFDLFGQIPNMGS